MPVGPRRSNTTLAPARLSIRQLGQAPANTRGAAPGQVLVEQMLLLVLVVAALVTFYSFTRAAISSRVKAGSDMFGHGLLYDPP